MIGIPYLKKNLQHLNVTVFEYKLHTKKAEYQFDNLFDGNERLGNEINALINNNWKEIYDDVSYGYEFGLSEAFKQLSNLVFRKVSCKYLFPL